MYGTLVGTVWGTSPLIFNREILFSMVVFLPSDGVQLAVGSGKSVDKIELFLQCLPAGSELGDSEFCSRMSPLAPSSALLRLIKNPPDYVTYHFLSSM